MIRIRMRNHHDVYRVDLMLEEKFKEPGLGAGVEDDNTRGLSEDRAAPMPNIQNGQ